MSDKDIIPKVRVKTEVVQENYVKSKLPVMPLSVLFPKGEELDLLLKSKEFFEQRVEDVKEEQQRGVEAKVAKLKKSEEFMLNQILQWISVSERD